MGIDESLKDLLQLAADVQDGLWEASARVQQPDLVALFQAAAVQWNNFADQVFPILLQMDHTSPDAKWRADPNRTWMNPSSDAGALDDLAVCEECMQGLQSARQRLETSTSIPRSEERRVGKECRFRWWQYS